jgi:hypothetical protein
MFNFLLAAFLVFTSVHEFSYSVYKNINELTLFSSFVFSSLIELDFIFVKYIHIRRCVVSAIRHYSISLALVLLRSVIKCITRSLSALFSEVLPVIFR